MTTTISKNQILRSLELMDASQMKQVETYVSSIVNPRPKQSYRERMRAEGLRQIRQALRDLERP